jgi:poly(3-hydroxybutyrate) depolymerase
MVRYPAMLAGLTYCSRCRSAAACGSPSPFGWLSEHGMIDRITSAPLWQLWMWFSRGEHTGLLPVVRGHGLPSLRTGTCPASFRTIWLRKSAT